MAKVYIAIAGITNEVIQLKDVQSDGTLIGDVSVTGEKITGTDVFAFEIELSKFYSLFIDDVVVETAEAIYLESGLNFGVGDSGEILLLKDIDADGFQISNIKNAVNDQDAVALSQVKSLISQSIFPSPLPDVSMDATLFNNCIIKIDDNSSITGKDITYIFFYVVTDSTDTPSVSIDSNGLITLSGSKVVQSAVKTPYSILPKTAGWTKNLYVHFGYYLMNSAGISIKKIGSYYTIPNTFIGLDNSFEDLSAVTPTASSIPVITDFGSNIGITIPAEERPTFIGEYEIVYGFMDVNSTDPTISTNTITNMTTYTIQRSSSRSFVIPKPLISSSIDSYKICVSYRFVNPFTTSSWWRAASTSKLKTSTLTKFPERLNQSDLDSIISQVVSKVEVDLDTGNLMRK